MTKFGPSNEEEALLAAVGSSPGISARRLARLMGRRTETVLRLIDRLVDAGRLERRGEKRTVAGGRRGVGNGLYLTTEPAAAMTPPPSEPSDAIPTVRSPEKPVAVPLDQSLCPSCGAHRRHYERGPECRRITELRELGRSIGWQHVGLAYGRSIQATEMMWSLFLDRATPDDLVAGIRQAGYARDLQAQIARDKQQVIA